MSITAPLSAVPLIDDRSGVNNQTLMSAKFNNECGETLIHFWLLISHLQSYTLTREKKSYSLLKGFENE